MSKVDSPLPFDVLPWDRPKVCVVGDVMVDAYMWGRVSRVSPEAPVPVVDVTQREIRAGGAGNVVKNLHALGAEVTLVSVVGQDASGADLTTLLEDVCAPHLVVDTSRPTTVKTRVISGGQHVVRVDEESTEDVNPTVGQDILNTFNALLEGTNRPDVVILEDYDKGLLTEDTVSGLLAICRETGIPVAVDPKLKRFSVYQGVALFKPNLKELNEGLGLTEPVHPHRPADMAKAVERLHADLGCQRVMVTLGEHGTWIHSPKEDIVHLHIPAVPREVMDVSGAGDTVISVAALLLASGCDAHAIARVSNLAGGWVCERVGVVPISKADLQAELPRVHAHISDPR